MVGFEGEQGRYERGAAPGRATSNKDATRDKKL